MLKKYFAGKISNKIEPSKIKSYSMPPLKQLRKYHIHTVFLISTLVLFAFFLPNCTGGIGGPVFYNSIDCNVSVGKYKTTPLEVNLTIKSSTDDYIGKINKYKIIKPDVNDVKLNNLYYDKEFKKNDKGNCVALRESAYIQTGYDDWGIKIKDFMELKLNKDIEALYVAYDDRFETDWLTGDDYELQVEKNKNGVIHPCYIETTIADNSAPKNPYHEPKVKFKIYKRLNFSKSGDKLTLPGNSYMVKSLLKSKIMEINPIMYTIIIKPKVHIDTKSFDPNVAFIYSEHCLDYKENLEPDYVLAESFALKNCRNIYPEKNGYVCTINKGKCEKAIPTHGCPRTDVIRGSVGFLSTYSFLRHSEIRLEKNKSFASIKINKKPCNSNVNGHIHFQYILDNKGHMQTMQLNALQLEIDPLHTEIGKFTNIKFILIPPVKADCLDKFPPSGVPCQTYRIYSGEFLCNESSILGGKPIVFILSNTGAIDINITKIGPTRSFRMKGGPLNKVLKVNNKKIPVEISIDLTGTFTNFAPFAEIGEEFKRFSECTGGDCPEGSNLKPIILDASGSFDIDDGAIPPGNYAWYENYGLSTEKLWGKGERITLPSCQMSFGVHYMTLEVRDSAGVRSTAEFKVKVVDTKPPVFASLPGDRFYLATKPGSVRVIIGMAKANDNCQNNVMIDNNAPRHFEAGIVTPVTWTADDGFGNNTKAVQNVYVFLVKGGIFGRSSLDHMIKILDKVITTSQSNTANCTKGSTCHNTLENLETFLVNLTMPKIERVINSISSELQKQSVVESLRNAQESLQKALNALDNHNTRKAYEQLEQARNYLREVVDTE